MRELITIESVEQKSTEYGGMITFKSDGDKYKIFETKKDGNTTKAWQQWQKYGFSVGDTVEAEVAEKEKEYNGNPYIDRRVLFFGEVEGQPAGESRPPKESKPNQDKINKKLIKKIKELDERVSALEEPDVPEVDIEEDLDAEDIPF